MQARQVISYLGQRCSGVGRHASINRHRCAGVPARNSLFNWDGISTVISACVLSALLFSAGAAAMFFETVSPDLSRKQLKDIQFFCISADVASVVRGMGASRCAVASSPDEAALLSLLASGQAD